MIFFFSKGYKIFWFFCNSAASSCQGIVLAFCEEYLCLKPGVCVGADQSFNSKSWAVPPHLVMNLS